MEETNSLGAGCRRGGWRLRAGFRPLTTLAAEVLPEELPGVHTVDPPVAKNNTRTGRRVRIGGTAVHRRRNGGGCLGLGVGPRSPRLPPPPAAAAAEAALTGPETGFVLGDRAPPHRSLLHGCGRPRLLHGCRLRWWVWVWWRRSQATDCFFFVNSYRLLNFPLPPSLALSLAWIIMLLPLRDSALMVLYGRATNRRPHRFLN